MRCSDKKKIIILKETFTEKSGDKNKVGFS